MAWKSHWSPGGESMGCGASIRKAAQRLARSSSISTKICPKARKPPVGNPGELTPWWAPAACTGVKFQPKRGRGLSGLRNVRNSGSSCVSRSQFDHSIQKGDCDLFGLVFGLVNFKVAITRG